MANHEHFMKRCLELAALGTGTVSPNPLVGCVIVHNDKIIGEGYHHKAGEPHAEVNAIQSVKDPSLLQESTLYVSLEPCAHHGKTPPCADLIVSSKIPRVVICNRDPFDQVDGKGIERLKENGIDVTVGLLENEGRWLNRRFFTFHERKRPYIILKFAQTADGFLDHYRTRDDQQPPLKITGQATDRLVHKWRSEENAILVGQNTVQLDDPSLTTRHWKGAHPIRLVIDPELQVSSSKKLLSDGHPTWVFNALRHDYCENNLCYIRIEDPSAFEVEIMNYLYKSQVQSLIIEGGATTINRFIEAGLWDEARVITGGMRIGSGVQAPSLTGSLHERIEIESDILQVYLPA